MTRERRRVPATVVTAAAVGVAVVALVIVLLAGRSARRPHPPASLAWPAPAMHNPQVVRVTSANTNLKLDQRRDYVLKLPRARALQAPAGLTIWGGHNVVIVGGTVNVTGRAGGAVLEDQTGTIHLEGIRFTGSQLMEGIDLSEPDGATVQLEHLYIGTVHGSYTTNHADLIQTWAGPRRLLIDGLWGSTQYQGFFLLPNQAAHFTGPPPELFDLRNVYINDRVGAYALWLQTTPRVPLHLENVTVTPNPVRSWRGWWLWPKPNDPTWNGVRESAGAPADPAKRIGRAGMNYAAS